MPSLQFDIRVTSAASCGDVRDDTRFWLALQMEGDLYEAQQRQGRLPIPAKLPPSLPARLFMVCTCEYGAGATRAIQGPSHCTTARTSRQSACRR